MSPYDKAQTRLANGPAVTQEQIQAGANWYRESREAVREVYGKDWPLFVKCLAATSANASLSANMTLAKKAFNMIQDTGTVSRGGFCKAHFSGLNHVIAGRLPRGRKVHNFAKALLGDESAVVVDVWMLRYAGIDRKAPTPREYDYIESRVREEAEDNGVTPSAWQAVLWARTRGAGESYARHLCQYRLM